MSGRRLPSSQRGGRNGKLHSPRRPASRMLPATRSQGAASTGAADHAGGYRLSERSTAPVPASAAACASQEGLPKVQTVGRTGMTLPYACPSPRKGSILGPRGPWHHQRAPNWRLRLQDGRDSQRMMLGLSERDTHRHGKMAERGREGRAHGVMGSEWPIARLSREGQKNTRPSGRRRVTGRSVLRDET